MDRMRDRLDKIARRSMSAPASSGDASQPTPDRPASANTRQNPPRQGKASVPRTPAIVPPTSRRPVPAARVTSPPARLPSSTQPAAPHDRAARSETIPPASRRPIPLSSGAQSGTTPSQSPVGTPAGRPPVRTATPRKTGGTISSLPTSKPAQPADVRTTNTAAAQADTLDTDRILELPARVTAARKQRQTAARADAAPPTSEPELSESPRVLPMPARKRVTPVTPITPITPVTPFAPADVAAPEPLPPVALPVRPVATRPTPLARKTAPAPLHKTSAERRTVSNARALPAAPASLDRQTAHQDTGDDSSLPENIESVGGAMQRFLAVLAERRRQRAQGGGDGGDPPGPPTADTENICPVCGGAGYVRLDVPVGDRRFGQPVPCKCKEREFEERRRMEEERRVLELDRFFSLKPFGDKTFETFNPRVAGVKEAYEAARTFAEDPTGAPFRWLVLMGSTGVGKTHLAAAIAAERLQARSSVFFAVVPDLLDHLRAAFAPSAEMPYNEMFETVREVEMLILDDLGSENSTAWATEKLFQIINYRYNFRMPTVITTNSRLFEHMDERIASRLADTSLSRTVVIEAPSRRPHPARKQAPPRW